MAQIHAQPKYVLKIVHVLIAATFGLVQPAHAQDCDENQLPKISIVEVPLGVADQERKQVGALKYRGGIWLQHEDARFGGFSGVWVSDDGTSLAAVSDGGYWMEASLSYDNSANLVGLELDSFAKLADEAGNPLVWWEDKDAESLDFDGEKFLVGFEETLRVWSYESLTSTAENIELPADFSVGVPPGGGYSSIASDSPGSFYLLTEFARNDRGETKGFVQTESISREVWFAPRGDGTWLPVDWAVMPGGDLILAEVARAGSGRQAKLHRLRLSQISRSQLISGDRIVATTLAEFEPPAINEKYEGLSSRRGANGETLIYIMSDSDNRRAESTVIRMFELMR